MYVHLNTDALDGLPPADAYKAATQIHHHAKHLGAAYADRLAATLAAQHGQHRAAELLGIAQPTLANRISRHKKEHPMATRTITTLTPQGAHEVSRTWESTILQASAGSVRTWMTRTEQGRRIVLVPVHETHRTRWALKWIPADTADIDLKMRAGTAINDLYKSTDIEESLRDATLWLHENPQGPQPTEPAPRPDSQTHTVRITRNTSEDDVVVTWQRRIYPQHLGGGVGPWRAVINGEAAIVIDHGTAPNGRPQWEFRVGDVEGTITAATAEAAMKEVTYQYMLTV